MDPKFVLPKIEVEIEVEETPSNGRDDQHLYYRVLRDGEPISGWVGEHRMYEIADEARARVRAEDVLRPEERRVLEIEDELAAVQGRLGAARLAAAPGCRHPATTTYTWTCGAEVFTSERCKVCHASRSRAGVSEWQKYYAEEG